MFKSDLVDLDALYLNICNWDYYQDLVDESLVPNHIEEDNFWEIIKNNKPEDSKYECELERIPVKFSNAEEYIKNWMNLFLFESRAQITRSKLIDKEESEKFLLNYVKFEEKRKFFSFELIRQYSKGVNYSNGDLILIHRNIISDETQKEHALGIVERFVTNNNVLIARIVLLNQNERSIAFSKFISKDSVWLVTRVCNLATITREYQALFSIENLRLHEILIHPGIIDIDASKSYDPKDYFFMPKKLEMKLRLFFNSSQLESLKNSIKKRGVTLIQGPPGTGKSTTILGILSVIINSLIKKEGTERRNSLINSINEEIMYDDSLSSQTTNNNKNFIKSHSWLYDYDCNSVQNFDKVNFSIDEIFCFTSYPSSTETDCYKTLNKPVDEDVMPPEKILVCAPSNVAIDEIIRKIISKGLFDSEGNTFQPKIVRIGPNFHPDLKEFSLDYLVSQRLGIADNFNMGASFSNMVKDVEKIKFEILSSVKIVCSTLSMAGSNLLTSLNQKFDTVVIDEAAQAVEISTLIPLKYGCERLILVGDPKQLAATVFSRTALKFNYDQSLFLRFQEAGHEVTVLKTQYRMHKIISKFISDTFYQGLLDDDESISETTSEVCHSHPAFQPFTYYDLESDEEFKNNSYCNEGQINVIVELINYLKIIFKNDISMIIDKVAVISPYSIQVNKIRDAICRIDGFNKENMIEVNTVDGFQGKEKSIIIFSTVRSKGSRSIGFLSDERRMNVGLSRAKSSLIVIGDSKKLIQDANWEKLVKYAFKNATFYKIKGKIKEYFANFEENYHRFLVSNEESFVKFIYHRN